jgi:hypothetical protein
MNSRRRNQLVHLRLCERATGHSHKNDARSLLFYVSIE